MMAAEIGERLAMPSAARADGSVSVELDVPGTWVRAVWTADRGAVAVELDLRVADHDCANAIDALLERTVASVTGARLLAGPAGCGEPAVLAVDVANVAAPQLVDELARAFTIATLAARLAAAEAEALSTDAALARRYLRLIAGSSGDERTKENTR
jgi:hypothetical protein